MILTPVLTCEADTMWLTLLWGEVRQTRTVADACPLPKGDCPCPVVADTAAAAYVAAARAALVRAGDSDAG